jgi:glyoxylase-like metal-dependent hydrolase (beta-lactamase superfamily II)
VTTGWQELADGVLVRRHRELDLNCGLVLGEGACLVVDTRSHLGEAADLVAAVRTVTPHPWTVVNTHAHYDHCFGNAAFRPAAVWASRGCAADLAATGELQRAVVVAGLRSAGRNAEADLVRAAPIDPPDHLVDDVAGFDVGGREVVLRFLGRGHTDHDLVVEVEAADDATVVFAGDLVEEGARRRSRTRTRPTGRPPCAGCTRWRGDRSCRGTAPSSVRPTSEPSGRSCSPSSRRCGRAARRTARTTRPPCEPQLPACPARKSLR